MIGSMRILTLALVLIAGMIGIVRADVRLMLDGGTSEGACLSVGETLVMDVRNPMSGGYDIVDVGYDNRILILLDRSVIRATSGLSGDFGRIRLVFKANGAGRSEIVLLIARPWEKNIPPTEYVRAVVDIRQ